MESTESFFGEDLTGNSKLKLNQNVLRSEFFKLIDKEGDRLRVSCQICGNGKILKGYGRVTSNFVKHLKQQHGKEYKVYIQRKRNLTERKTNQLNVDSFEENLIKFIINTVQPLSVVENPYFKALFSEKHHEILSNEAIIKKIHSYYLESIEQIKLFIARIKYICTTVDTWFFNEKNFVGVTCHWLNESLEGCSVGLACKYYEGPHDNERILIILQDIYSKFNLDASKIVGTVTNCLKTEKHELDNDFDLNEYKISKRLSSPAIFEPIILPEHVECAYYTLNLLVTTDFNSLLKSEEELETKHKQIFSKCEKLWKDTCYTKTAETVHNALGFSMNYHSKIQWISSYEAIERILCNLNTSKELFDKLCIPWLSDSEISYLREYKLIMEPIAKALSYLKREQTSYYGYLLPTIFSIKTKLLKLEESGEITQMKVILSGLSSHLEKRFSTIFDLKSEVAIVAAITCPDIKIQWLPAACRTNSDFDIDHIYSLLDKVKMLEKCSGYKTIMIQNRAWFTSTSFWDFDEEHTTSANENYNEFIEFLGYLDDPRQNLDMLNDYPFVKHLFTKFNTILSSSAAVNRLFDVENIMTDSRRYAVTAETFEKLIVLRANKKLLSLASG